MIVFSTVFSFLGENFSSWYDKFLLWEGLILFQSHKHFWGMTLSHQGDDTLLLKWWARLFKGTCIAVHTLGDIKFVSKSCAGMNRNISNSSNDVKN